jgi:4-amino-4-deoxychorismate lyase
MQKQFKKYMSQLLESIYLNHGEFRNLSYHQSRMRDASRDLFKKKLTIELGSLLTEMDYPSQGVYKTRIVYDTEIRMIEFVPYEVNSIRSLKIVRSDTISYEHKFLDRSTLHELFNQRGDADDILIVKNGFITDSYYANIIFRKEDAWYTPRTCLLKGTMRQYLLDAGLLVEADIDVNNYLHYQSFKLINAMLGVEGREVPIASIS